MMHSLGIIHGDIKNENIMWSSEFNKNVFVDFGLSLFLNETISQNTYTNFFGTYFYACDEMKELMNKKRKGWVDLYYNDVVCFQNTLLSTFSSMKSEKKHPMKKDSYLS